MEIWKDIPGYEGRYQASTLGRIKSVKRNSERIMKQTLSCGYYLVHTSVNGKKRNDRVHRLVALTFLIPDKGCDVVDHIDTNTLNNKVSNLRWTTTKGNSNNTLTRDHLSRSKRGDKNPMHGVVQTELLDKLHKARRKAVYQIDDGGILTRRFDSIAEASKTTGIDDGSISAVCAGKRYRAGGYRWRFDEES